jgi:hypothetical protein
MVSLVWAAAGVTALSANPIAAPASILKTALPRMIVPPSIVLFGQISEDHLNATARFVNGSPAPASPGRIAVQKRGCETRHDPWR